jgi:Tfp pilus assembly PilM family ATPase
LLLDVGHQATTLVVLLADGRLFSRRIEPGGNDFTGALMHHFGIAAPAAENLKHRFGLGPARTGDPREAAESAAMLTRVADQLVFELRRSLTFAETLPGFPQAFSHVTLSGGAASMPGLTAVLSKTLGMGVQLLDPMEGRHVNWRGSDEPGARAVYAQAMGLMERWL